jgi:hypothetical protein
MTIKSTAALKAKVKASQKANAAKLAEAILTAKLNATLALESSPVLFDAKVKLGVISSNTKKIQEFIDFCSQTIEDTPVYNNKTRDVRKWNGTRRYEFGTQINLIHQLVTGIMYSCSEHKPLLLAHTGLDIELIEQTKAAFGSTAYYSTKTNLLTEAKDYDVEKLKATVAVIQSLLGVVVDTSLLTEANFSLEFGKGEILAHNEKLKADTAIAETDLDLV